MVQYKYHQRFIVSNCSHYISYQSQVWVQHSISFMNLNLDGSDVVLLMLQNQVICAILKFFKLQVTWNKSFKIK